MQDNKSKTTNVIRCNKQTTVFQVKKCKCCYFGGGYIYIYIFFARSAKLVYLLALNALEIETIDYNE